MIKDDKIYWNETEEWVDTDSVLQEITDMAADVTKKSMSMKMVSHSDCDGKRHCYPTIRVANGYEAEEVAKYLNDVGVPAVEDLYEDDDGYYPFRQIWSVEIPAYKLEFEKYDHKRFECTNYVWNSDKCQYELVSK